MIQKRMNADNAVSPVVGVMLMLVVTIVIAAVVALFASGVVTSTEVAPNAVVKVDGYEFTKYGTSYGPNSDLTKVCFKNIGGNDLDLTDMKVVFTFEGADKSLPLGSFNKGKWNVGQILTIDADPGKPVYGVLAASVKGESVVEYKFMTVGGQIVAKGSFVVNPENVAETYSLTANKTSIASGDSVRVTFTVPSNYEEYAMLTASEGYELEEVEGSTTTVAMISGVKVAKVNIVDGVATFNVKVTGDGDEFGDGYCYLTATVDGSPTVSASCNVAVINLTNPDAFVSGTSVAVIFEVPSSFNGGTATLSAEGYSITGNEESVEIIDGEVKFTSITVSGTAEGYCDLTVEAKDKYSTTTVSASFKVHVTV